MIYCFLQDGWGRWQLGFHALFTLAANCPTLRELTISEEHLEVRHLHCRPCVSRYMHWLAQQYNIQELAEQDLYPHYNRSVSIVCQNNIALLATV